jgi:Na+/melibiose symporter-like transporter
LAIEGPRRRIDRQTTGGLGNIARAFAHRNFLVYVSGNSISLIGWWLERVAVGWLTWSLTHSGAWLGLISLADFLPVLFLAPFAGVLADRRDRVWTIRLTQWIGCLQASLLAILVVGDAMTIEILLALVLMLGIASGVAQPSRLALIPTLVDRESLASALAINSVIFNLARFIGPALAGIVIAEIGIAAAFAANAVGYIAFQISLLNLRALPPQPAVGRQNVLRASVEAFSYACQHSGIGPMLLLFVVTTIRHTRLYRAVSWLRRSGLRPRAAGLGDADLDGRARRDLWRQLDGAALGDHRARQCRAGLHSDHVAGDPRLHRD